MPLSLLAMPLERCWPISEWYAGVGVVPTGETVIHSIIQLVMPSWVTVTRHLGARDCRAGFSQLV